MVGLVRSTRYVLALASPAPPAPLPRSGFVQRPNLYRSKCSLAADHDARDRSIALWKRLGAKSSFWGYQWGYFLDLH